MCIHKGHGSVVLGLSLSLSHPLPLLIVVTAACHHGGHSTCDPPHEQWLMRLGAGGVSFGAGPICIVSYREMK